MIVAALFASFTALQAQEAVYVGFTASTESGDYYCPFTSVNVTNVTRGWTETLIYPDTLLILANTDGIDEFGDNGFHLGEAFPNPFSGYAEAMLQLSETDDVLLRVIRLEGREIITQKMCLEAGTHRLIVHLSSPGAALLSVMTNWGWQAVKLVQVGYGERNSIEVDHVSSAFVFDNQGKGFRGGSEGDFEPGDLMRYEALLEEGEVLLQSEIVTQEQYTDETITFHFHLERPDINTTVNYVGITDAIVGGYGDSGYDIWTAVRGNCWSTSPDPTIHDDHTVISYVNGGYSSPISDLQEGTKYYLRSYVTTLLGTFYGDQLEFTTFINGGENVEGTIDGLFTVAEGRVVYFSNGNLMYNKTTGEWSFMENQYDIVENNGQDVGFEYANHETIGLFGWATSGWDNGNDFYQPYSTRYSCHIVSFSCCDRGYGYGPLEGQYTSWTSLLPPYADADWGVHNAISNGGNTPGLWRTLTGPEWYYLFNTRITLSGIRYAKAMVNEVNGVIVLPDDWDPAIFTLNDVNSTDAEYVSNDLTVEDWATMEDNGAVFLPAAGMRWGGDGIGSPTIAGVGASGYYWSTSPYQGCYAKGLRFSEFLVELSEELNRYYGCAVRLVRPAV